MRPLLASLALLLLALSRPIESSAKGFNSPAQKAAMKKIMVEMMTTDWVTKITDKSVPTFRQSLPASFLKSIDNGVLCALEDNTLAATMKTLKYDSADRDEPTEQAKAKKIGIDCDTTSTAPEWNCFCKQNNTIDYCVLLQYKATITATKEICHKEALEKLKTAAPALGMIIELMAGNLDEEALKKLMPTLHASSFDGITDNFSPERANLFCELVNPDVEQKFIALYGASVYYAAINRDFDVAEGPAKLCKSDATFAKSSLGSCICANDRGFLFCSFKELGKILKDAKALVCEGGTKFVKENMPKSMPQLMPGASGGSGGSGSDANKDKAAATSSLLAPLAAAAAAMLLRH